MEKLSSLWLRFMPTLVSPATSIFNDPPTCHPVEARPGTSAVTLPNRRNPRARVSTASGWRSGGRSKSDGDLAEFPVRSEDQELDLVSDRVLRDDVGELLRR